MIQRMNKEKSKAHYFAYMLEEYRSVAGQSKPLVKDKGILT